MGSAGSTPKSTPKRRPLKAKVTWREDEQTNEESAFADISTKGSSKKSSTAKNSSKKPLKTKPI